jgi:hypothetical protein
MEWMDAGEMVKCLNQKLAGWANYFKLGPVTKAYRFLDKLHHDPAAPVAMREAQAAERGIEALPRRVLLSTDGTHTPATTSAEPSVGKGHDVQSESRMREMRLSGSMSGM